MFFFFFNAEKRIGFKKLSEADLGLSSTSNQTHIGLFSDVLNFLNNKNVVKSAMLIYDDYCEILTCNFDRIEDPDGTFRSPKIRKGDDRESVVSKIREFASAKPNADWFLIWSGLESEELVFWLVCNESKEYAFVQSIFPSEEKVLTSDSPTYSIALDYLTKKVNFVSIEIQKDLEISSQTGKPSRLYKRKDIEKAEKVFREIGRAGEELIAEYLDKEKQAGRIKAYIWENKNLESGFPYDFLINDNQFVDVKTTNFDFEQYMFFSNEEIEFIAETTEHYYSVFRVYDMKAEERKLKVCNKCLHYMSEMRNSITNFQLKVDVQQALLQNIKLGIQPNICFSEIQPSIVL